MKYDKKIIGMCMAFTMMLGFTQPAFALTLEHKNSKGEVIKLDDFLDTKSHWAHNQIYKWAEYGLVAGNNGYFMPNAPIKRGDLAIIVDRMLGLKATTYNLFNDLPNNSYYRDAVLRCVASGYIAGTSSNTVSPEGFATREQVAVILCRMFNIDTSYSGYTGFKDDATIGSWAKSSVYAMKKLGYMNGTDDGRANPKANITRAELVTILSNIANTYIPKSDKTSSGNVFTGQYPTNLVTSRNIELSNTTVGRDVVLTQATSNFTATNTNILGRILVMSRNNITLKNVKVPMIYLVDGKSTITGVSEDIGEIYVAKYATETTLDVIPKCITLESGVRVKIGDTMYENTSNRTKTYYGIDIKADIAAEQNYVVGGPRIRGAKFTQDQDNTIKVSNVIVDKQGCEIEEIGVVWLDQENNKDIINPSCQNYDDKKVYKTNKFNEPISFTVDTVDGTRAYRVYVKDSEGLYAYSDTFAFTEYEFRTSLKIYGENYPDTVDVELVMQGDSIPDITTVRVVYGYNDLYNEDLSEIPLRLYTNPDAETQPDGTKYRRYIGQIKSPIITVDDEKVANPPTHFGYIINFRNGDIINRYPVLSNAMPENVSPVAELITGSGGISGNRINVINNKIKTRYVIPQEVGVVYKESDLDSVSRPTADAAGWNRSSSYVNVGLNDIGYFDTSFTTPMNSKYTYYAAYVKTSNGYWYGDVNKIVNNVKGDEGGPVINSIIESLALNNNSGVIGVELRNVSDYSKIDLLRSYINVNGKPIYLNTLENKMKKENSDTIIAYFKVDGLNSDANNNISICIYNTDGLKSNTVNTSINTKNSVKVTTSDKTNGKYGLVYRLNFSNPKIKGVTGNSGTVIEGSDHSLSISSNGNVYYIEVIGLKESEKIKVSLTCEYIPQNFTDGFSFKTPVIIENI